jgi:hypothetical protein
METVDPPMSRPILVPSDAVPGRAPAKVLKSAIPEKPDLRRRRLLQESRMPAYRIPLMVLLFAVVVVAPVALRNNRVPWDRPDVDLVEALRHTMLLGPNAPRYFDPAGRFSIAVPEGWRWRTGEDAYPYELRVLGPDDTDLCLKISEVDFGFDGLRAMLAGVEIENGIDTHMSDTNFLGWPAVFRTMQLYHQRVIALDFVAGRNAYHLLAGLPPSRFDEAQPYMLALMDTLKIAPAPPAAAPPDSAAP